ncbi:MAG: hypothetical protein DRP86_04765 [Candidatus Neomarinimicrobiota bacterium]|nr:MAG: hypothetical protein DRP86_04765 [Candidatus Neomarinimicrobiota bacterium]
MTLSGKMNISGEGRILSLSDDIRDYFSGKLPVFFQTLVDWKKSPFRNWDECLMDLFREGSVYLFLKKGKTNRVLFLVSLKAKSEKNGSLGLLLEYIPHERQLEIELRQQKRYNHEIISTANIMFIRTDARYRIKDMNPWAEKVLDLRKQERLDQNILDVLQLKASDRRELRNTLKEKGRYQELEMLYRTPKGEERWLLWNVKLLVDFQYGQSVLLFFGHDITERCRLEKQIAQSEKLSALGQLAAGIAHDVSKPMVSISSLVQMLEAQVRDEYVENALKMISRQVEYLSKTVRQLVDLSRPLQGEREIINVNALIHDAVRIVRFDSTFKDVRIVEELTRDPAPVSSAYDQLLQVFINIFLNAGFAIRQCETPVLRIKTAVRGDQITIEISDNGEGIPRKYLERVFEPFFTTRSGNQGTGLGLWVCHHIVTALDGKIHLESEEGRGTTVKIKLPVLKGDIRGIQNSAGR